MQRGRFEDAVREVRRALELDPPSLALNWSYGLTLHNTRQLDAAIAQLRKTVEMEPGYHLAHNTLGAAYLQKAMFAEAISSLQTARRLRPAPGPIAHLAYALARSGQEREARELLTELVALPEGEGEQSENVAPRSSASASLTRRWRGSNVPTSSEISGCSFSESIRRSIRYAPINGSKHCCAA